MYTIYVQQLQGDNKNMQKNLQKNLQNLQKEICKGLNSSLREASVLG